MENYYLREENSNLTGYASKDRPWLKYYDKNKLNINENPCSLYEYMYNKNKNHKAKVAINYYDKEITYGELFDKIEETAKAFLKLGVKEGEIVTLCPVNTPEFIYCFYALNKIGAISNMILPISTENEIKHYLEEVKSKVVVVLDAKSDAMIKVLESQKNNLNINIDKIIVTSLSSSMPIGKKVKSLFNKELMKKSLQINKEILYAQKKHKEIIRFDEFLQTGKNFSENTKCEFKDNRVATIVRTGGTTGLPKGVMLTNENYNSIVLNHIKTNMDLNDNLKCLSTISLYAAFGSCNNIHLPLSLGINITLEPIYSAESFAKDVVKYRPNITFATPEFYAYLRNYVKNLEKVTGKKIELDVSFAVAGGGKPSMENRKDISLFYKEHSKNTDNENIKLDVGYGLSEACAAATCTSMKKELTDDVGIPFPDIIISVFDTDGATEYEKQNGEYRELKYNIDDNVGEICITGPTIMKGYYNNLEETENTLKLHNDGKIWLHTGDIGYIKKNGSVQVIGRKRRLISMPSFKFEITAAEEILENHPAVEHCVIVAINDPNHFEGKAAKANIVLKEGYEPTEQLKLELQKWLIENKNERYKLEDIRFRKSIPLTPGMGKKNFRAIELEEEILTNPNVLGCFIKNSDSSDFDMEANVILKPEAKNDNIILELISMCENKQIRDGISKKNRSIIDFKILKANDNSLSYIDDKEINLISKIVKKRQSE